MRQAFPLFAVTPTPTTTTTPTYEPRTAPSLTFPFKPQIKVSLPPAGSEPAPPPPDPLEQAMLDAYQNLSAFVGSYTPGDEPEDPKASFLWGFYAALFDGGGGAALYAGPAPQTFREACVATAVRFAHAFPFKLIDEGGQISFIVSYPDGTSPYRKLRAPLDSALAAVSAIVATSGQILPSGLPWNLPPFAIPGVPWKKLGELSAQGADWPGLKAAMIASGRQNIEYLPPPWLEQTTWQGNILAFVASPAIVKSSISTQWSDIPWLSIAWDTIPWNLVDWTSAALQTSVLSAGPSLDSLKKAFGLSQPDAEPPVAEQQPPPNALPSMSLPEAQQALLAMGSIAPADEPGWGAIASSPVHAYLAAFYDSGLALTGYDAAMSALLSPADYRAAVVNAGARFLYSYPATLTYANGLPNFVVTYPTSDVFTFCPFVVTAAAVALVQTVMPLADEQRDQIRDMTWNQIPFANPDVPWAALSALSDAGVDWQTIGSALSSAGSGTWNWKNLPPPWLKLDVAGPVLRFLLTPDGSFGLAPSSLSLAAIPWASADFRSIPWGALPYDLASSAALAAVADESPTTVSVISALTKSSSGSGEPETLVGGEETEDVPPIKTLAEDDSGDDGPPIETLAEDGTGDDGPPIETLAEDGTGEGGPPVETLADDYEGGGESGGGGSSGSYGGENGENGESGENGENTVPGGEAETGKGKGPSGPLKTERKTTEKNAPPPKSDARDESEPETTNYVPWVVGGIAAAAAAFYFATKNRGS